MKYKRQPSLAPLEPKNAEVNLNLGIEFMCNGYCTQLYVCQAQQCV